MHTPKVATPRLTKVVAAILVLIAGCVIALAAEGQGRRWNDHPALQSFSLSGQELPAELYLVRTRGELGATDDVVIHGASRGVFLVSGERDAVAALAQSGHVVIPLRDTPLPPRIESREWTPLLAPDPAVAAMVAEVEWSGVSEKIQWLADFGTRYSYASNHHAVAESIGVRFAGYGLTPVLSSFVYNSTTMWNVEATQVGTVYPDSFFIICGHFDSTSENAYASAPGADDNGTGTATVLTAAEILTRHDFEYSIRYVCFGGEEQGLRGSADYAADAAAANVGIVGVLNFDMMGYWASGVPRDLEIETNVASQWLAAIIVDAANTYTSAPYLLHVYDGAWWGDHASFWDNGYAAVNHEEAWDWGDPDFNPYYHSTNDVIAHVDSGFTVDNVKVGVAALATLAVLDPATGIDDRAVPPAFAGTLDAHPNPFNHRVTFSVSGVSDRSTVTVSVYDVLGRRVAAVPVALSDGSGSVVWNAVDGLAQEAGTGVYFGKLDGVPGVSPVKIVLVK